MRYRGEAARNLLADGATGPASSLEPADDATLARFHAPKYLEFVRELGARPGRGLLDRGDTPSFPGATERRPASSPAPSRPSRA